LISRCETQRAVILYKDCRPLPSSRDFGDVGVLYTFSSIGTISSSWDCQKLAARVVNVITTPRNYA
jgi:hypothetical protein